jgi:L-alanine-DL-glutamate epimerase-like enolase superfamily enzyme
MALIRALVTGFYRIPLPEVLSDSTHGVMRAFELVTCGVQDADGQEGVGYTFTVGRNGGAIADILAREISELAAGQEADRIERLWHDLWWALHYGGRGGPTVLALSAFDMALWDLKAKRAGLPLWRLLGGFDPEVPCYAGGIDLDLPLPDLLRQTDRNLEKGFRAIKMKVGRLDWRTDVERVASMRRHLGERFPLMLDANMRWTADLAVRAARAFAEHDPVWLEEPVVPEDVLGHARVQRDGGVAVASGENLRTLWEFRELITTGECAFPEPDVTNCGGITPFMKIAALAEAFNRPVTSHGAHDVTVHLLAACPNRSYLEAHGFGLDAYIAEPLAIRDGVARAPDRAGHGILFDWTRLETIRA